MTGPLCDVSKAVFAQTYWNNKLVEDFTWNKYPLELSPSSGGNYLLFGALPGQAVDAIFTSYQEGQSIEILNTKGGPLDQETFCGCLDYTLLLPSTCNATMVLTIDVAAAQATGPSKALAVGTPVAPATFHSWKQTSLEHSFGDREGSLDRATDYNTRRLYVSKAPFAAYTCDTNSTFHLDDMQVLAPIVHTPHTDANCADACSRDANSDCVAYVFSNTNCALYFPGNWVAPAGVTASTATALSPESVYCKRIQRTNQITDQSARYSLSAAFDAVVIFGTSTHLQFAVAGATKLVMHACSTAQLACEDCTKNDIMRNLNADLASLTSALLQTDSGNTTKTLGCALSKDNQFEDCVPPNVNTLSDIDKGYYFQTDMTGTPGHFASLQTRGKMVFRSGISGDFPRGCHLPPWALSTESAYPLSCP